MTVPQALALCVCLLCSLFYVLLMGFFFPHLSSLIRCVFVSSVEPAMETKALEGTKVHDLGSTAGESSRFLA